MDKTERRERTRTPLASWAARREAGSRDDDTGRLLLIDLLNDFAELAALLFVELHEESWLDAYLLSAGMNQIVDDYLDGEGYAARRAAPYLAKARWPAGPLAAHGAEIVGAIYTKLRRRHPRLKQLAQWQTELSNLVRQLARRVVSERPDVATDHALQTSGQLLCQSIDGLPTGLLRTVIRLPSCFRSFDQRPADLDRLVRRFLDRVPDRSTPMAVIGVRTSGSYLAPLIGGLLDKYQCSEVVVQTTRPGYPLSPALESRLGDVVRRGGLVLIADDPPISGDALDQVASQVQRTGVPLRSIVLLLQLFTSQDALPETLRAYESVLMASEEWTVHEQLRTVAVQRTLAKLFGAGSRIEGVERLALPQDEPLRGHAKGLYRVVVRRPDHELQERYLYVAGTGLGYFGRHSLAIAQRLRDWIPQVYGYSDGLLYREWLPDDHRLSAQRVHDDRVTQAALIDYVRSRHEVLRVDEDKSLRVIGRQPAWEVASNVLSRAFGRAWFLARIPLVDPAVKRILRVPHPSVVDGSMTSSQWFMAKGLGDRMLKVDFDRRAFSHLDLYCYDPLFDLARLRVDLDLAAIHHDLQQDEFEALPEAGAAISNHPVSAERWLLYQLVHVWDLQREHPGRGWETRRAGTRALQRYFAGTFFEDAAASSNGSICGIDVDGVLETASLGFPCLSGSSALALSALLRHGYRPILITGRSLPEVQDRCRNYRLAGGVAEYGAVVYDHRTGRIRQVISDGDREHLEQLRWVLNNISGVSLDPDYRYGVRACVVGPDGRRRPLPPTLVAQALAEGNLQSQVQPIPGDSQTDFTVPGVDKAAGVRVLAAELGVSSDSAKPLALAVGDTLMDLPMFPLAELAFAPRHAEKSVRRAGVPIVRAAYQAGFAEAVSRLLGHRPGNCDQCRVRCSADTRLLLTILSAQEQGIRTMLKSALNLAARNLAD